MNEEIVGTDINYNWTLNAEGDLNLTSGSDNLSQAIYLRLTSYFNSLAWCYNNYGSYIKDWLGKLNTNYNRSTLITEIANCVVKDCRIYNAEVELLDWDNNMIGVKINAHVYGDKIYTDYFIFSSLPRKNEDVYNPSYHDTYIRTRDEGYYAKQGELITVSCQVFDETSKIVPIGEVALYIGGYQVDIDNNPQEICQSGSENIGTVTYTFRVPLFVELGEHELTFKYKGIFGYNNCQKSTILYVLDKIPTVTTFQYPKEEYDYYYANDYDVFTDSVTYTKDFNNNPARLGTVEYYIDEESTSDTILTIDSPIIYIDDIRIKEEVCIKCLENINDYSNRFVFDLTRMFYVHEIIELISSDGTHIDNLEVIISNGVYYLISTSILSPETGVSFNSEVKLQVVD